MKKIKLLIFFSIFINMMFLSGCESIKDEIEKIMWEQSGVSNDIDYIQYQQMEEMKNLDEKGLYHSDSIDQMLSEKAEKPRGSVHVSFAGNEYLQTEYYYDAAFTEKIDKAECYLNPGEAIYSSVPISVNTNPFYYFSEFRILEVGEKGTINQTLAVVKDVPGVLFLIPDDFAGKEISIVPIGEYHDRSVNLASVYVNPEGKESLLENGFWEINGNRYGNGMIKLNPMETYRVRYDYSIYQDQWYFEGSEPEPYWDKNSDATVTFLLEPSDTDELEYKVKLHPYGSIKIVNSVSYQNIVDSLLDSAANIFGNRNVIEMKNIITLLQINGVSHINDFSDSEINLENVKAGDEVRIRVPAYLKIISNDVNLPKAIETTEGRDYRFSVPDTENMNYHLSISQRNDNLDGVFHEVEVENGKLSVCDTSNICYTENSELPAANERVTVTIIPDDGFCIYGRNVKNNIYQSVMKYDDFESNTASIITEHSIRPGIVVTLDTEDESGECVFWSGNEQLSGTVMLREGQELQFDYLINPENGYEIVLTNDDLAQVVGVWNPYAITRDIEVTESLQGITLHCRDYVTLQEVEKTNDDFTYSY